MSMPGGLNVRTTKNNEGSRMSSGSRRLLLGVILMSLSVTPIACSQPPRKPTIVGERRIIAVDQEAGTVTVSMSLWVEMARTLRRCKERSTP